MPLTNMQNIIRSPRPLSDRMKRKPNCRKGVARILEVPEFCCPSWKSVFLLNKQYTAMPPIWHICAIFTNESCWECTVRILRDSFNGEEIPERVSAILVYYLLRVGVGEKA